MLSVLPNDRRLGGRTSTGSHSSSACRWLRLCSACFHNRHEMSCTQSRRTCADALRSVYVEPGRRLRNHSSNASPVSPTFSVRPTSDVYSCSQQKTSAQHNISQFKLAATSMTLYCCTHSTINLGQPNTASCHFIPSQTVPSMTTFCRQPKIF